MAQVTDRNIGANPTGFDMRTELNNIIAALESDNSGSSAPLNTVAFMKWLDTSNATYYYYKERNHDNTAWVTLFRYTVATKIMEAVTATNADKLDNYHLDALGIPLLRGFKADGLHENIGNVNTIAINSIYNSSDTAIGTPYAQWGFVHTMVHSNTPSWRTQMWYPMQNNSGTVYQRVMIDGVWSAWVNIGGVGVGQSWQDVTASRALGTTYTNSTGKPIIVYVSRHNGINGPWQFIINGVTIGHVNGYGDTSGGSIVVPHGATYSVNASSQAIVLWCELR